MKNNRQYLHLTCLAILYIATYNCVFSFFLIKDSSGNLFPIHSNQLKTQSLSIDIIDNRQKIIIKKTITVENKKSTQNFLAGIYFNQQTCEPNVAIHIRLNGLKLASKQNFILEENLKSWGEFAGINGESIDSKYKHKILLFNCSLLTGKNTLEIEYTSESINQTHNIPIDDMSYMGDGKTDTLKINFHASKNSTLMIVHSFNDTTDWKLNGEIRKEYRESDAMLFPETFYHVYQGRVTHLSMNSAFKRGVCLEFSFAGGVFKTEDGLPIKKIECFDAMQHQLVFDERQWPTMASDSNSLKVLRFLTDAVNGNISSDLFVQSYYEKLPWYLHKNQTSLKFLDSTFNTMHNIRKIRICD